MAQSILSLKSCDSTHRVMGVFIQIEHTSNQCGWMYTSCPSTGTGPARSPAACAVNGLAFLRVFAPSVAQVALGEHRVLLP